MVYSSALSNMKKEVEKAILGGTLDRNLIRLLRRVNEILSVGVDDLSLVSVLNQLKAELEFTIGQGAEYDYLLDFLADVNAVLDGPGSGSGGEINTGQNIGVGGVGVYAGKSGAVLRFRNINSVNNRITVTNDTVNNEIDLDIGTLTDADIPDALTINGGNISNTAITLPTTTSTTQGRIWRDGSDRVILRGASSNRTLLNSEDNLANLANTGTARRNLFGYDTQTGSSKPATRSDGGALVAGDRWLDTANRRWWYWDGTYWLSEQVYVGNGSNTINNSGTTVLAMFNVDPAFNLFLLRFSITGFSPTTHDGSNNYIFSLQRRNVSTESTDSTLTTGSVAPGTRFSFSTTLNLHRDVIAFGQIAYRTIAAVNAGAPAPISSPATAQLEYRLAYP